MYYHLLPTQLWKKETKPLVHKREWHSGCYISWRVIYLLSLWNTDFFQGLPFLETRHKGKLFVCPTHYISPSSGLGTRCHNNSSVLGKKETLLFCYSFILFNFNVSLSLQDMHIFVLYIPPPEGGGGGGGKPILSLPFINYLVLTCPTHIIYFFYLFIYLCFFKGTIYGFQSICKHTCKHLARCTLHILMYMLIFSQSNS